MAYAKIRTAGEGVENSKRPIRPARQTGILVRDNGRVATSSDHVTSGLVLVDGEQHGECASFTYIALYPHSTVVLLHDGFDDG